MSGFAISLIWLRKEAQGVIFELERRICCIDYLHLETAGDIDEKQIIKAADRWAKRQPQPPNLIHFRYGKLRFISHARQWIAFPRVVCISLKPRALRTFT